MTSRIRANFRLCMVTNPKTKEVEEIVKIDFPIRLSISGKRKILPWPAREQPLLRAELRKLRALLSEAPASGMRGRFPISIGRFWGFLDG